MAGKVCDRDNVWNVKNQPQNKWTTWLPSVSFLFQLSNSHTVTIIYFNLIHNNLKKIYLDLRMFLLRTKLLQYIGEMQCFLSQNSASSLWGFKITQTNYFTNFTKSISYLVPCEHNKKLHCLYFIYL